MKAEILAPTPPPAAPVVAALPARSEKVEVKQEAEDAEESEEAEEGATDAEESEEAEVGASPQEIGAQPVPVPSAGMMEGAPISSAGPGTRLGVVGRGAPPQPEAPQYVSLNFDNADLELVLRSIADITRINFIIGPGVKANVTMRTTTRVPSSEVMSIMESVLEVNNLAAVKEGSYYKIVPIAVAQQEPQDVQVGKERIEERERYSTQVVQLDYLSADETSKIVQSLIGKGARMIVHKETNSLIIAGFNSTLKRILETIKALDVPTKRDNIQRIFVYFVENAKAAELANTLNTLYGRRDLVRGAAPGTRPGQSPARPGVSGPSTTTAPPPPAPGQPPPPLGAAPPPGAEAAPGEVVGEVTIVSDETTNSLVIKTSPRNYEIIEATIKQIDIIPKQVLIELLLAHIRLDDDFNFSLEEIIRSGQFLVAGSYGAAPLATAIAGVV
ncbi:MAG TPA: secretin N-terminal domain-containing protein, partial [Patescibacteria group bacterium]|nr:secretin N-terminal domain-containing protein [Patescibacteria group bacterium]